MFVSSLKSARNYFSTYLLLVSDYIAFLRLKAIPVISGVVLAGLVYPLPFAIMAGAIYAMMADHHSSVIKISRWTFEVGVDSAFLYALGLALLTLLFNFASLNFALNATTSWQTSLMWRTINTLPVMARWDSVSALPLPIKPSQLNSFLEIVIRPGYLIGRMVAIGVSNLVITLAALAILAWLDPISVAVLLASALPLLPLYAWALRRLVAIREKFMRERKQQMQMLMEVLDRGVLASPERRIDASRLSPRAAESLASGHSFINDQLQGLNLISLIVGLHVFASIAIIYVINGASLSTFLRDKVVFFVVLLIMMRAALSLISLIARLSRNYNHLALLRVVLYPKRKRVTSENNAPAEILFTLEGTEKKHYGVKKGKPCFVVLPKAKYAYELLPLSNALKIVSEAEPSALRYIMLFDEKELENFLNGHTASPDEIEIADGKQYIMLFDEKELEDFLAAHKANLRPDEIEIADGKQSIHVPFSYDGFDPSQVLVIALSLSAWKSLVEKNEVEAFCADRIVFVVISELCKPRPPSPETLLVVSDGVEIVAVGPFDETWDDYAEEVFRPGSKKANVALDESDGGMMLE